MAKLVRLAAEHSGNIPDGVSTRLREHFTEAQVSELCAYVPFISTAKRLGALLRLQPASCELPSR